MKREYLFVKIILANGEKQTVYSSYSMTNARNYAKKLEQDYGVKTVIE